MTPPCKPAVVMKTLNSKESGRSFSDGIFPAFSTSYTSGTIVAMNQM
jgi:hypothetical protein